MRLKTIVMVALAGACIGPASILVRADPLPVIVTYELKKERQEAQIIARNPKAFWVGQVLARIEAKIQALPKPPKAAVTVEVEFVVAHDGRLISKSVEKSSGDPDVDRTAIAMLNRAQPFPPMPATMSDTSLAFTLPVRFR